MVMMVQILAGALLVLGSGLIFHALLALERHPRPLERPVARPAPTETDLRHAA